MMQNIDFSPPATRSFESAIVSGEIIAYQTFLFYQVLNLRQLNHAVAVGEARSALLPQEISVKEIASILGIKPFQIIEYLIDIHRFENINSKIDFETLAKVCELHTYRCIQKKIEIFIEPQSLNEDGIINSDEPHEKSDKFQTSLARFSKPARPLNVNTRAMRPPPWYIGFTEGFKKQLDGMDRRLLGRVFEKIAELTENPTQASGDTIKPLTGEMKGFWRIRFGDHRLIYFPDQEHGNISLYSLSPRGSAYA